MVWVITGRRGWSQVAGPPEAVGPGCRFGRFLTLGYALACRVEVIQHPVHEASLDRSVRIIDEQDQPGGALRHAVPDQGRGQISPVMVEAGRDRGS